MQEKPENSAPNGKIGYTIDADFPCGNIKILKLEETKAQLAPDLRDTQGDWFYFHFRVRGAGGKTLTFTFPQDEISAFGAAVSADGVSYAFRPEKMRFTPREFTYAFGKDENEVYFAFSLPYPVRRFEKFARENKLSVRTLCVSEGGRNVPYLALGNPAAENCVLFTCRHHACESVASYVLEGAMQRLIQSANGAAGAGGINGAEFLKTHALYIVPFIDVDGVERGDQGKNRAPHDHNRDYISQPIYNVTRALLSLVSGKTVRAFVDFHDPWLYGGVNDSLSFVYGKEPDVALDTLAKIFENEMRGAYFPYEAENNTRLNTLWNVPTPSAKTYFAEAGAEISVSIETPYFGLKLPKEEAFIEIGSRFVSALDKYLKLSGKPCARNRNDRNDKNDKNATATAEQEEASCKITFTGDLLCPAELTEITKGDYNVCFKNIQQTLKKADYTVGNLETPVAGEELKYTYEKYRFNTPSSYLYALKNAGFKLLSCAMNHCMDRGEIGIDNTLNNIALAGLEATGIFRTQTERDKPFIKEINGIRISFVNYTYGTNAFAHHTFLKHAYKVNLLQPEETLEGSIHLLNSAEQIAADVKRIYKNEKEKYSSVVNPYLDRLKNDIQTAGAQSDFVIMLLHCGGQYNAEVDAYTRFIADKIRSFGADAIIGLHPHIVQPCEIKNGVFTAYCLGNFLSRLIDDSGKIDWRYNAVLNMQLSKTPDGKIRQRYSFVLCYTDEERGVPIIKNTYDMYRENQSEKLKTEILEYASRFAGSANYETVQTEYEIPFGYGKREN